MRKKVKFMEIEFPDISINQRDIYKVRGYFADKNTENEYIHNHTADGTKVIYRYPLVQYKKYGGHPFILVFGEAIPSVYAAVMDTEELTIGDKKWPVGDINIRLCEKTVGDGIPMTKYQFLSPWLCLNQENYRKYIAMDEEEKQGFLKKILIGNILSLCGGFGVTIEQHLKAELHIREVNTHYKGVTMIAFMGDFEVNCALPCMCGLGKGVSRGLGTFRKRKGDAEDEREP